MGSGDLGYLGHQWVETGDWADEKQGSYICRLCGYVPGWVSLDELEREDQIAMMPLCPVTDDYSDYSANASGNRQLMRVLVY